MMRNIVLLLAVTIVLPGRAAAKEVLDEAAIAAYLDETNPYVYTAVGQQYVSQARAEATKGEFDTRLGVKYDNKRYPASQGELADVFLEKPTESGLEFLLGYRKAEGIQEYNNIKTGDEGEVRVGLKVPVFAVVKGMNARRYQLQTASLDARQSIYLSKENLRQLRFEVYAAYYTLLHQLAVSKLEADLLEKARQREGFVRSKVEAGELPEIALLEIRRQILGREQRLLEADNGYEVSLASFLRYIGLSRDAFEVYYVLPPLPDSIPKEIALEEVLRQAWEQRPDVKTLQFEKERFELHKDYNAVEKYPRLNVALYGVHDFQYNNGVKVSLDMQFPIERRSYTGRKREIQKGARALDEALERKRIDIETGIANRLRSLRMLRANLKNALVEIEMAARLESAEIKRYRLGAGDLMRVNQRELDTLEIRQKRLSYQLKLQLLGLEIDREKGVHIGAASETAMNAVPAGKVTE